MPSISGDPGVDPCASIVINNHNYGRFLTDAIESALGQTWRGLEVIVVDDGSTDESWKIVTGYGNRIRSVRKNQGGQASALNAGLSLCRGDILIFLDADDVLLPDVVERVVTAFRAHPRAAKVYYRLQVVDAAGVPTGRIVPAAHRAMPSGDLRRDVLTHPDDLPWSPTSGNAFPRWVLREIMPIPEAPYSPIGADLYLINVAPLFGSVVSLSEVGGRYRVHGANAFGRAALDLDQSRRTIVLSLVTHRSIARFAAVLGHQLPVGGVGHSSLTLLAHRMVSLRLDPARHPIASDRRGGLLLTALAVVSRRRDRAMSVRARYAAWFVAMAVAPRPLARWLAERLFFPRSATR